MKYFARSFIKYLIYNIFYSFLLLLSVDKILRHFAKHKRLIITYHGVSLRNQNRINGRHLLSDQFEKHLIYLKKNFDVVSLETICEMKRKNITAGRRTLALTFDDGFLNNLQVALPLLERYQLPATFFCCSINLEDETYIHPSDFLDLIHAAVSDTVQVKINEKIFVKHEHNLICPEDGMTAYQFINSLSYHDWKMTLLNLSMSYPRERITRGVDEEVYKLFNTEHLRRIASSPIASVGSHCHSHVNIKMLSRNEMKEQFDNSEMLLEKYSGRPVNALAYPYGYYNKEAMELAIGQGYKYLFAAGDVEEEFKENIFPRMVILSSANYVRNIFGIHKGFNRFGF